MAAIKEKEHSVKTASGRQIRIGKWIESLKTSDVNQLWTELHRVVSCHPLVRASKSAGLLVEEGKYSAYTDLTQELFVALLSKERFQHYIDSEMTNQEIEAEISQIELTNLLTAELRKRYPESYRLARRVSTLIQTSSTFRRFDIVSEETHRRLADRIYGLSEWKSVKSRRNQQEMEQRVKVVSFHQRDTRMVGCTGDAQIVISNPDLEKLIVKVLKAIDSPCDVRTLRSLVMSRLPVMDIYLVPISGGSDDNGEEDKMEFDPADIRENPEQEILRREGEGLAVGFVDQFLTSLNKSVRGKAKQYNRMIGVLWHCYLSSNGGTQLEVAETLGVSDSLISDYRRRIEGNLQSLSFSGVGEARQFELALRRRVRELLTVEKEEKVEV
ncbi:MAG: hypothetical protein MUC29_13910 [Pyrinomonadaceae bacterium]|jgi:hypothetical protein|nr:hypothetical protein [Pyrinomonadaceae bacterium]